MTTTTAPITRSHPSGLLRLALQVDAGVTGLNGAAYLSAAPLLHDVLGLPTGLLRGVGVFLLCYAAAVWAVARSHIRTPAVVVVVAANLIWTTASVAVAATEWATPTTLGSTWTVLQAVIVGGFAAVQWVGLRRRSRSS